MRVVSFSMLPTLVSPSSAISEPIDEEVSLNEFNLIVAMRARRGARRKKNLSPKYKQRPLSTAAACVDHLREERRNAQNAARYRAGKYRLVLD